HGHGTRGGADVHAVAVEPAPDVAARAVPPGARVQALTGARRLRGTPSTRGVYMSRAVAPRDCLGPMRTRLTSRFPCAVRCSQQGFPQAGQARTVMARPCRWSSALVGG